MLLVYGREDVRQRLGRFRRAEEEMPAGPEREVKYLQHALLRLPVDVDEEVAAAHQVEL